jgi:molybdopterin-guanine dinucleotide biosynthesis protein MobB
MRQIPAISIMGWSGSGKTTLIEKLIPILHRRQIRVGILKHDGHDFEMDHPGKDTWRFSQAGAEVVAISSGRQAAVLENRELELNDLLHRIRDVDLILVEGYKASDLPRIEVHRLANNKPLSTDPDGLAALVTDADIQTMTPCFALDDAQGVAALICRLAGLEQKPFLAE